MDRTAVDHTLLEACISYSRTVELLEGKVYTNIQRLYNEFGGPC